MSNQKLRKIEVGKDLGEYQYRLTSWRLLKYIESTGDDNPWYREDSPFGGIIAPATICDSDLIQLPGLRQIVEAYSNRLVAGQEYEFINPARPGKLLTVKGIIADAYIKGERQYVVFEGLSTDEDNRDLVRTRMTYCCWHVQ